MNKRKRKKLYPLAPPRLPWMTRWVGEHDTAYLALTSALGPLSPAARRIANKRVGGFGPWFARERRARTAMRHLERRRRRWRRVRPRPRGERAVLAFDGARWRPLLLTAKELLYLQHGLPPPTAGRRVVK